MPHTTLVWDHTKAPHPAMQNSTLHSQQEELDPGGGQSLPELLVDSVVLFSAVSCCSHGIAFLVRRASFLPSLGCSCSSSTSSRHTSRFSLPPPPTCHVRIHSFRQSPGSSEWPVMLMCFSVFLHGERNKRVSHGPRHQEGTVVRETRASKEPDR